MSASNNTGRCSSDDDESEKKAVITTALAAPENTADSMMKLPQRSDRYPCQLCLHCQNVANNWDIFHAGASLPHFSDVALFRASALSCNLCAQLLQGGPAEASWNDTKQYWKNSGDPHSPGIITLTHHS